MIFYDYYGDVPSDTVDAFVRERELGRLVTVSADGSPHIGLYPFLYRGTTIEMHLNRADASWSSFPRAFSTMTRECGPRFTCS